MLFRSRQAAGWQASLSGSRRRAAPDAGAGGSLYAEELWGPEGASYSIHQQPWPRPTACWRQRRRFTLVLQVNGKVRAD